MAGIYIFLVAFAAIPAAILAWPGEVEILPVPQKCPDVESKNFTVHLAHTDCTKFCKCSFGVAHVMDCPAKLHFNKVLQVCDYAKRAKCDGKGVTSGVCDGDGPPAPNPGTITPDPVTNTPDPGPNTPDTEPTPDCTEKCTLECEGETYPHECSCSKYYVCTNGDMVLHSCKSGEHWSKKKKKCRRSAFAGCVNGRKFERFF